MSQIEAVWEDENRGATKSRNDGEAQPEIEMRKNVSTWNIQANC